MTILCEIYGIWFTRADGNVIGASLTILTVWQWGTKVHSFSNKYIRPCRIGIVQAYCDGMALKNSYGYRVNSNYNLSDSRRFDSILYTFSLNKDGIFTKNTMDNCFRTIPSQNDYD